MAEEGIGFGRWCLLPRTRTLLAGGERIVLGGRAADILLALIEADGAVVDKDTLISRAWGGRKVEDGNLPVQISALRRAFGAEGADIVVTVPGRGYRFGGQRTPTRAAAPIQLAAVRPAGAEAPTRGPSLAVLPFRTLGDDADQAHIADGIVEDLITALSRIRWFYVLARNSAFSFKGHDISATEIGSELGVRYVVTGTVRRAGGRVRVNVDLVDTADGVPAWSDRFEYPFDEVFALQDRIVGSIVAALEPGLRRAEIDRLRRRPTELPRAYEAYLRAMACMHPMTRSNCEAALGFLDQALAVDPTFALALAAAASCRMWRVSQSFPEDAAAEAEAAIRLAEAALAQARDDPLVLAQVGVVFVYLVHRSEVALLLVTRAVDLHPNSATTRSSAGWAHIYADDPEAAIPHLQEALRLDPLDPGAGEPLTGMSYAHLAAGRPDAAVRWGERAIAGSPERLSAHRAHVAALGAAGLPAGTAVAHLMTLDPTFNLTDYSRFHSRRSSSRLLAAVMDGLRRAGVPERPSPTARPALRVVRSG
ncbi:winged helix-turn-helix domain-containing protein [Reyranella sp. CPCC 100927]|uniref:winged helix-turn-helix domain-containing protein n=1 Tax=Reyranella sp. CPCC 100927 TaxID=2599616 RepID=UPI0011B848DA|nr:winged helix-turn-helix domain-containing protein [Reyranella sp. CPCC 100927]TWS97302.1 CadC-family transcriptional regulator [Reyranella sp. CPCC 100927]